MKRLLSTHLFSNDTPRRQISESGFTLIEILISITIVALVLATVYGVFSGVSAAKNRLDQDSETYHKARVIFERFGKELHGAYLSKANKDSIFKGAKTETDNFTFELSTTSASPLSSTGTGFALVSYTVTEDSEADDGSKVILRSEKPLLSKEETNNSRLMRLAPGIEFFNMRFYADGSWNDSWDSTSSGLPEMVEIELKIKDATGNEIPFLSAFRLPEMSR